MFSCLISCMLNWLKAISHQSSFADNLNGAKLLGRIVRVDHVSNYKKMEEENEEKEQQKREARGVCRAYQRGECNRGASCKFSHDEQVSDEIVITCLNFSMSISLI